MESCLFQRNMKRVCQIISVLFTLMSDTLFFILISVTPQPSTIIIRFKNHLPEWSQVTERIETCYSYGDPVNESFAFHPNWFLYISYVIKRSLVNQGDTKVSPDLYIPYTILTKCFNVCQIKLKFLSDLLMTPLKCVFVNHCKNKNMINDIPDL